MKILSLSSNVKIKIVLLLLLMVMALGLSSIGGKSFSLTYHQSSWNEYAPQIDIAFSKESLLKPADLKHIYGGVVSHHIPVTIPRLVEFYGRIKETQLVKNIIVIGPDHNNAGLEPVSVSNSIFLTDYGEVRPIDGLAKKLKDVNLANIDESPFDLEHSVGSQILIINKIFPGVKVTPIILRSNTTIDHAKALGKMLATFLDDETVLIASIDFSHFLSTDQATPVDQISGEVLRNLDIGSLSLAKVDSNMSLVAFMEAMIEKKATDADSVDIMNTNDLMQNSDYTTGYVFGYWGIK